MGLDSVELVLRTEDEFGITFSDEEAAAAITVGELYDLVLSKIEATPGCLTSKAFYLTRRALMECFGAPRRSIRPSTQLEPFLPEETRRKLWGKLQEEISLRIPGLRLPDRHRQRFYTSGLVFGVLTTLLLIGLALYSGVSGVVVSVLGFFGWIGVTVCCTKLIFRVNRSLELDLPADTAGELSRVVLSLNQEYFVDQQNKGILTSDLVWEKLVDLICDQLQVGRDEVVPNAKFVDDLGVC